ncbi:MAG: sialate O-acetylesterase [Prosthecobacter sp.]
MKIQPALLSFLVLSTLSQAAVKLPALFSDHMVLQADKAAAVWGWADAGEEVQVSIAGQTKTATADAKGAWSVKLDPLPASSQAQTLVIGGQTIQDVLVGEVWLGSGQSNMAMSVKGANDLEGTKAQAALPSIRVFTEGSGSAATAQTGGKGAWVACSPETVERFSATAFFFGRSLHAELKTPVGLIVSAVGGTPIEAWISPEVQKADPKLAPFLAMMKKVRESFNEAKVAAQYEKQLAKWAEDVKAARAAKKPAPAKPRDPVATFKRKGDIGGLFNGKISPLVPYTIRGAIWYQGEANSQDEKAPFYQEQLAALARDWRARWADDFPFAWVQLPNFTRPGNGWPQVRDGMRRALQDVPKSGMAITLDIGDAKNIHPTNKQEVGRRLALWALGDVYAESVPATSGPLLSGTTVRDGKIVVSFKHAAGLKSEGPLTDFEIAGADGQWQAAEAVIDGETVVVSSAKVTEPKHVRYAWKDNPSACLRNGAGIPASTFSE